MKGGLSAACTYNICENLLTCTGSAPLGQKCAKYVMNFSPINVYQMWVASHEQSGGLWVTRTTWSDMCAHIISVGDFKGPAPYYGNPVVHANLYSLNGIPKQPNFEISVPGTYKTWRQIAVPTWWKIDT